MSARHAEWSAIASTDDEDEPCDEVLEVALAAAQKARHLFLPHIAERCHTPLEASWVNHWPGDHYRLLTALIEVHKVRYSVEVGTYTGMGSLAMLAGGARVCSYDVIPWQDFPNTLLRESDFGGGLEQRIGDLSAHAYFLEQASNIASADLIFIDGPKDGAFEPIFFSSLLSILRRGQLLVVDDIRRLNMLQLWRNLPLMKLDVTSLGHWSGTGIALA